MDAEIVANYDAHRDLADKPFRCACYAPFTSMVFDSIGRVRVCCVNFEHILGDIKKERLDEIWSGARIGALREALRRYDFSKGCGYCYWKLTAGVGEKSLADATLIASKYDAFSVEADGPFWPKHLEFHLSNRCNLECQTCFGEYSHLIREKREKLPPYPMAYGEQFFSDLRKYLPHLRFAQFLGGEPFLIPEMYRVWDMLIEDKLTPHCHVNTNGTVFSERVERVLEHLAVSLNLSIDSHIPERFEAIRTNAKFDKFLRNYRRFREICDRRQTTLRFMFTLSRLNWDEFPDFLLFAEDLGVAVSVAECFNPKPLSLFTLPADQLAEVVNQLERKAEVVRDRLRLNRAVLEQHLGELRHRLQSRDEIMFFEDQPEDPPPPWIDPNDVGDKLLDPWRGELARVSEAPPFQEADARALLADWNAACPVDRLVCDPDDTILEAELSETGTVGAARELRGLGTADLFLSLQTRYGAEIEVVEVRRADRYVDRVIAFSHPGGRATLVRSLVLPRFDEAGQPIGTVVFIASMPDNRLVVLA